MKDRSYPLAWPKDWPKTKNPGSSQFKTTLAGALKNVEKSIEMFASDSGKKVDNLVISSNVALGKQNPAAAGVACYFSWDGLSTCIAVDRYAKVQDNLQAIHHCLEAERTKLRHGGIELVRAAFRGYAALPPPGAASTDWRKVLGLTDSEHVTLDIAKVCYRKLASEHHPDAGGNDETMAEINTAWEQAKAELT